MTEVPIRLETRESAVHVVLDRPDKANALTLAMWTEIPELVRHAEGIPGARCLVLRSSTDEVFSAGVDVAEYATNAESSDWALRSQECVVRATDAIADSRLVTIARIAGPCAGGAVGLATACDFRIAARDALFALPPARLGLVYPQSDTARLVDLVGVAAAKRLLLTGARMDAAWARRVGLVDESIHLEDVDAAVDQIVAQVAAGAPDAVWAMKRAVADVAAGIRSENSHTQARLLAALEHPDHREGTTAFLEGRSPRFSS